MPSTLRPGQRAIPVVVADGQTVSPTVDLKDVRDQTVLGVLLPTGMEGTTLKFQMSVDGSNFFPVYNSAGEISITVAAARYYQIDPNILAGVRYLRLVIGTAQTGAATLYLVCK